MDALARAIFAMAPAVIFLHFAVSAQLLFAQTTGVINDDVVNAKTIWKFGFWKFGFGFSDSGEHQNYYSIAFVAIIVSVGGDGGASSFI